jgi:GT2 family glycosyltransferase
MRAADVSVIVPVRNDATRLQRCLASVLANTRAVAEIIVVDNGSSDASADVARRAGATVLAVPHVTVARARNVAAARASGSLLAFVDADHLIDEHWIEAALAIFTDHSVAAAGAPYSPPADANWIQRAYDRFRPSLTGRQQTDWLGSGNLVIRRDVFTAVGGFDATLEACEDVDLCSRLRRAGYPLIADPGLRSVHLGDPATVKALFLGELWRGRNNLRVSLRGPWTWRALPSVLIPVVNLASLAVLVVAPAISGWLAAGAVAVIGASIVLRTSRMALNRPSSGALALVQNAAVAAVYEAARALALVLRATHRTRRELAGEHAVA